MRGKLFKATVLAALVAVPVATAASTATYEGVGTNDPQPTIRFVVERDGDKRQIKRFVVNKLRYGSNTSSSCETNGRTGRLKAIGPFRKREESTFDITASPSTVDPLDRGELQIKGRFQRNGKAEGTMRFTFGKTGCKTLRTEWKARR